MTWISDIVYVKPDIKYTLFRIDSVKCKQKFACSFFSNWILHGFKTFYHVFLNSVDYIVFIQTTSNSSLQILRQHFSFEFDFHLIAIRKFGDRNKNRLFHQCSSQRSGGNKKQKAKKCLSNLQMCMFRFHCFAFVLIKSLSNSQHQTFSAHLTKLTKYNIQNCI